MGARADQGRFVGEGIRVRDVRPYGRVARVWLVDDVAGAVLDLLQDVAVLVEASRPTASSSHSRNH
ncbi:prephenate dehydratase [Streptomyces azureus]|uniref:Prephenate dehydratase n=1 Tax=Streptomyces azureus TaxID=146537 RepID=A0A0K8PVD7_STRAJ|nr:prephenate dehydratase [Streptomyces azureus]